MKVTNFTKEGDTIRFDIQDVSVRILNAFRRTIMSAVPVLAVEKVIFDTNTSILNDENLAHRIGLVPLTSNTPKYKTYDECECEMEGCANCTVTLKMEIEGPGTVYSRDLVTEDEDVKPVYETMPLVKLMPKQKIKLTAAAVSSVGQDHIKWQAGTCSYEEKGKGTYSVFVESFGQLPVEELVKRGFEVIEGKITQMKGTLK